jgi:hypothetical protein
LREAVEGLSAAVTTLARPASTGGAPIYPRSALLHTTFLARGCIMARRSRSPQVREFLDEFDEASSRL